MISLKINIQSTSKSEFKLIVVANYIIKANNSMQKSIEVLAHVHMYLIDWRRVHALSK